MQALRAVERHLNLDRLYVLGTNCVDNGPRQGLDTFLAAASATPETVLHYEFVQDYRGALSCSATLCHTAAPRAW